MAKKLLLGILCLITILSTAASKHYFSEEVYLSPGEVVTLTNLPIERYDYDAYVYVYLDGQESFQNHRIDVKSNMTTTQGTYCGFEMEVYAFDRNNHNDIISDSIYHYSNSGWSEFLELGITLNAEYVIISFFFNNCDFPSSSSMNIEIAVDRESSEPTPASVWFWADDTSISAGSCTYLNWDVENSQSVKLDGVFVNPEDYLSVCPTITTTYILTVTSLDGSSQNYTVTIYVDEENIPQPEVYLWPDEEVISQGGCTTVNWQVENSQNVYFEDEMVDASGYTLVCPDTTTTYYLTVITLDGATLYYSVTVTVSDELLTGDNEVYYWADRYVMYKGECATISWDVQDAPFEEIWFDGYYYENQSGSKVCPHETETYEMCYTDSAYDLQCLELTIEIEEEAPYLLVVTHSENLNLSVNTPDAWDQIITWIYDHYAGVSIIDLNELGIASDDYLGIDRAIENQIDWYPSAPEYILIIGGPAVVSFGEVENPMWGRSCRRDQAGNEVGCDWDVMYTDDLYGDINADQDSIAVPEIPVTRLPDGGDFEMFKIHFEQTPYPTSTSQGTGYADAYAIGHPFRPYVDLIGALMGASSIDYVPPHHWTDYGSVWGNWLYFILHGNRDDTTIWWGEAIVDGTKTYPEGWHIDVSKNWEIVVSNACFGGYLGTPNDPRRTTDSIALSFLRNGSRAFIGNTARGYSVQAEQTILDCDGQNCWISTQQEIKNIEEGASLLSATVFIALSNGAHPAEAFWQAKLALADTLGPSFGEELKDLHNFHFYGLPPFNQLSF